VGRGSAVAVRAWWGWISVRDFYEAAKQAQQLALRFDDIQRYRVRRRW
jgi:S-DNA-T family DNA segregation ATPase FtsK/SpoIIIE